MEISDLILKKINIPFKVSFKHASAERKTTESILLKAVSVQNNVGYGEGCPRYYVTHETLESSIDFFNRNKASLIETIKSIEDLKAWIKNNKISIDKNPAIWCAIELAILDLIANEQKQTIEQVLNLPEIKDNFSYSAILGDSEKDVFFSQLQHYTSLGFKDFKVKLSGFLDKDKEKINMLAKMNIPDLRVRIDANNLWENTNISIEYIQALDFPLFAVEEPLSVGLLNELIKLSRAIGIKIILDESFLKVDDFNLLDGSSIWIINLRISKMGGLIRSLEIAEKAQINNIPIIIGAQVGETSILSRAALVVANAYRTNLTAQEGAFGKYLLERDLCNPPLMFKDKGILTFLPQKEYGLQLKIVEEEHS